MHKVMVSKALDFGAPVLIGTLNEDESVNLAPVSSAWRLDQTGVLELGTRGHTFANLQRGGKCVLNFPPVDQAVAVDRLVLTTGLDPGWDYAVAMGFRRVSNRFEEARLTTLASDLVRPTRVVQFPIELEAKVTATHTMGVPEDHSACVEVEVVRIPVDIRISVERGLLDTKFRHHISPERWRPLIMSRPNFYGLRNLMHDSRLAGALR